jgi:hypothetical protein
MMKKMPRPKKMLYLTLARCVQVTTLKKEDKSGSIIVSHIFETKSFMLVISISSNFVLFYFTMK